MAIIGLNQPTIQIVELLKIAFLEVVKSVLKLGLNLALLRDGYPLRLILTGLSLLDFLGVESVEVSGVRRNYLDFAAHLVFWFTHLY